MMKTIRIIYWITTVLFSLGMGMSSILYLSGNEDIKAAFQSLGYPAFMLQILGVAKLLGAIVLLIPRFPRLKEWAYAGFTINLIGAIWSHLATGTSAAGVIPFVLLLAASYVLYHKLAMQVIAHTKAQLSPAY